ncbi:hypothetical protein CRE_06040 [Caenorhabditis remanei]|uniref:Uncharacterized protein n=1 Tax=Caenorhabditis remanei TaxID=31234 RepID=E3N6I1_CAERE|nr:hypothetical protein CRE_06040 [Caenorhabditis remanei]
MDPPDFSEVRGKAIVESLAITFGLNLPSSVTLNDVEKRWRDRIALMIRCAETGNISIFALLIAKIRILVLGELASEMEETIQSQQQKNHRIH